MTDVFTVKQGEWQAIVDGQLIKATFKSKGGALAAIPVERARRRKRR